MVYDLGGQGESVVDSCGENDQIPGPALDPDPGVVVVSHVKVPGALLEEPE